MEDIHNYKAPCYLTYVTPGAPTNRKFRFYGMLPNLW